MSETASAIPTRSHILGVGFAVPETVVTNDDLAKLMDTSDEWITKRTGIRQRHWITEGESGTALARDAARLPWMQVEG